MYQCLCTAPMYKDVWNLRRWSNLPSNFSEFLPRFEVRKGNNSNHHSHHVTLQPRTNGLEHKSVCSCTSFQKSATPQSKGVMQSSVRNAMPRNMPKMQTGQLPQDEVNYCHIQQSSLVTVWVLVMIMIDIVLSSTKDQLSLRRAKVQIPRHLKKGVLAGLQNYFRHCCEDLSSWGQVKKHVFIFFFRPISLCLQSPKNWTLTGNDFFKHQLSAIIRNSGVGTKWLLLWDGICVIVRNKKWGDHY